MFQRGNVIVSHMDFCARVIAKQNIRNSMLSIDSSGPVSGSEYAKQWQVEYRGINAELTDKDNPLAKYYETLHLQACDEQKENYAERKDKRSQTDAQFDDKIKNLLKDMPSVNWDQDSDAAMQSMQSCELKVPEDRADSYDDDIPTDGQTLREAHLPESTAITTTPGRKMEGHPV